VAEARCRAVGSPGAQARDENEQIGVLRRLIAVVENYPQLKADKNFLKLQRESVNAEDRIQAARRFNGNVRDFNTCVESFPSNLLAGMFGFKCEEIFEIQEAAAREVPKVER
jgi:LemA protein